MKKKIVIHNSKKAISDYNKKLVGFNEVMQRLSKPQENVMTSEQPMTLDAYLMSKGQPASFSVKMSLAKSMGINNYIGSKEQDSLILQVITGKDMNQGNKEMAEKEDKYKEKEHGFKEREMNLKEKIAENQKAPSADEIAQSLMKSIK